MKKLNFLAAVCCMAAVFTAMSITFVSCKKDKTDEPKDPTTEQNDGENKDNPDNDVTPSFAWITTGGATDVTYSSVTLWGQINTDTLVSFNNVQWDWGIEYGHKEEILSHRATKTICTSDLQGVNTDEYSVACTGLSGDTIIYYNAYLLQNKVKYIFGKMDSVYLLSRITVNSNNDNYGTVSGSGDYAFGTEVALTATPQSNDFYFEQWSDGNTENPRTLTVKEKNATYTAIFVKIAENGHEFIDLGLPSGLKWATCNVGATSPEEYGNYYAWGEVEPKDVYDWTTYKWATIEYSEPYNSYFLDTLTKYNTDSKKGNVDNKTILEPEDDAAHANWGGQWRLPTDVEWTELIDKCKWKWTTRNGVNGYDVMSKTNNNFIFLPAAGNHSHKGLSNVGSFGCYWANLIPTDSPSNSWDLEFYSSDKYTVVNARFIGQSVRPVFK